MRGIEAYRHQDALVVLIYEFLTVVTPYRRASAILRYQPLSARGGGIFGRNELPHIHVVAAAFVRAVGNPASVRREFPAFVKTCFKEGGGSMVALHRQHP